MVSAVETGCAESVRDVFDGATVMLSGFGPAGAPESLLAALLDQGARELTIVANNAGSGDDGLSRLLRARRVRKVVCSFPRSAASAAFRDEYNAGRVQLELVPQGTLAERIRAGGAGIPAFYTPTAVGTPLADDKEQREFGGRAYLLEHALQADFAFVRADRADRFGNLVYRKAARNFGPIMAMAAQTTIAEVRSVVDVGQLDPECVVTPGIFVDRLVVT
jgi:3-oxoadipate CoA-transferase alpha subunit